MRVTKGTNEADSDHWNNIAHIVLEAPDAASALHLHCLRATGESECASLEILTSAEEPLEKKVPMHHEGSPAKIFNLSDTPMCAEAYYRTVQSSPRWCGVMTIVVA